MALIFPTSSIAGATYQSGSSATYKYNGTYWETVTPATQVFATAVTASFATTASALIGSQATYLTVSKNSVTQSITSTAARLTNWDTPVTNINAGEWNSTTGIFTATKAGVYQVAASIQLGNTAVTTASSLGCLIYKNSSYAVASIAVSPVSASIFPPPAACTGIVSLAIGDTISIFGNSVSTGNTHTFGNNLTIQELPTKLQR
jgi:hypothetical protein